MLVDVGRHRSEIEIGLIIKNASEARKLVLEYYAPRKAALIYGMLVDLCDMSDEEAIEAAAFVVEELEIPKALAEKNLLKYEH